MTPLVAAILTLVAVGVVLCIQLMALIIQQRAQMNDVDRTVLERRIAMYEDMFDLARKNLGNPTVFSGFGDYREDLIIMFGDEVIADIMRRGTINYGEKH